MPDKNELICVDPVCGHKISSDDSIQFHYKNNNYCFCSKKCYNRFKKNPEKYSNIVKNSSFNKKYTSNLDDSEFFYRELNFKIPEINNKIEFSKIESLLSNSLGIKEIIFSDEDKKVTLLYNPDLSSETEIISLIENTGFSTEFIKTKNASFIVKGLITVSISKILENILNSQEGIINAVVNFPTDKVFICYIPDEIGIDNIQDIIKKEGFKIIFNDEYEKIANLKKEKNNELKNIKNNFLSSFILSVIIFVLSVENVSENISEVFRFEYLLLFLATIVQFIFGLGVYNNAFRMLKKLHIDSNVLAVTATTSIYIYSLINTVLPDFIISNKLYFDVSSILTTIFILSSYLIETAKQNISESVYKNYLNINKNDSDKETFIDSLNNAFCSNISFQEKNNLVLKYFSSTILLFSLTTFLSFMIFSREIGIGTAMLNMISVIAIGTPCLISINNSFAITASLSKAIENGWCYKNARSIQVAAKVDTVIFDKTGILTEAKPIITDIMTFNGFDGNTVLKIAASVENHSEHVLGNAIVQEAKNKNFDLWIPTDFNYILGMGIEANVNGYHTLIGNKQLMKMKNIETDSMERMSRKLSGEGKTTIFIAVSGKAAGIIAASDIIKEDSHRIIQKFKRIGIAPILVTGDTFKTALALSERVGIDQNNIIADASPFQKLKVIDSLQKEGRVVGLITENLNDSPSLKKADIVFSFINTPNKRDIMNCVEFYGSGNFEKVVTAVQFSRKTMSKIRQNTFWSYFYVLMGIPLSTGWFIPFLNIHPEPVIFELCTLLGIIFILINSLELRRLKLN